MVGPALAPCDDAIALKVADLEKYKRYTSRRIAWSPNPIESKNIEQAP